MLAPEPAGRWTDDIRAQRGEAFPHHTTALILPWEFDIFRYLISCLHKQSPYLLGQEMLTEKFGFVFHPLLLLNLLLTPLILPLHTWVLPIWSEERAFWEPIWECEIIFHIWHLPSLAWSKHGEQASSDQERRGAPDQLVKKNKLIQTILFLKQSTKQEFEAVSMLGAAWLKDGFLTTREGRWRWTLFVSTPLSSLSQHNPPCLLFYSMCPQTFFSIYIWVTLLHIHCPTHIWGSLGTIQLWLDS